MFGSLARRAIERWALRLARIFVKDFPRDMDGLGVGLRLLGKERFREGQMDIVLTALRGQSLLAVMPTGSGKSLCFQLPAVLAHRTTLIVSPLKALMSDQVMTLFNQTIPAAFINGDLSPQEKRVRYQLLEADGLKLLYCSPERFNPDNLRDPREATRLLSSRPSFLVVDEAHCVDRWGDAFRPDYDRLGDIRRQLGDPPVLAFTATAGREMQERILSSLGVAHAVRFVQDVDRPNISFARMSVPDDPARARLTEALHRRLGGRALVFVPTERIGNKVVEAFRTSGIDVPFYHGKLAPNARELILARFQGRNDPPVKMVVCTNAFGMGLDIPDIRLVVHWAHPASVEDYVQELGRAGRDGLPSVALLFPSENDKGLQKFMAEKSVENSRREGINREAVLARKAADIDQMASLAFSRSPCVRVQILRYFGKDHPRKSPWFLRFVTWLFTAQKGATTATWCCDVCEPRWLSRFGVTIDGRGR